MLEEELHRTYDVNPELIDIFSMKISPLRPLFFLHIPKSAGTSVRIWLQQVMSERFSHDRFPDLYQARSIHMVKRQLLTGHYTVHALDRIEHLIPNLASITFLREPKAILHSTIAFYRSLPAVEVDNIEARDPWLATWVKTLQASKSMEEFMSYAPMPDWMDGLQTRFLTLAGVPGSQALRRLEEGDMHQARERLRRMDAFGIAEDLPRSSALICDALGWPWLGTPGRHNETKAERPPPDELYGVDITPDIELYAFARELFEHRWQALCAKYGANPDSDDRGVSVIAEGLTEASRLRMRTPVRATDWFGVEDGLFVHGAGERYHVEAEDRWVRNVEGPLTLTLPTAITAPRVSVAFGYLEPSPMDNPPEVWGNGRKLPVWPRYEDLGEGRWRIWLDIDVWPLGFDRVGGLTLKIRHPDWDKPRKEGWGTLLGVVSPCWRPWKPPEPVIEIDPSEEPIVPPSKQADAEAEAESEASDETAPELDAAATDDREPADAPSAPDASAASGDAPGAKAKPDKAGALAVETTPAAAPKARKAKAEPEPVDPAPSPPVAEEPAPAPPAEKKAAKRKAPNSDS
jgi:hypothetical protein